MYKRINYIELIRGIIYYIIIVRLNLIYLIWNISHILPLNWWGLKRWGMTIWHTIWGILGSLNVGRTIRLRLPHPCTISTFFSWKIYIHKKLPLTLSGGGIFLGWTYCQVHFHYKMWGRVVRSGTSKMGERDCVVCNERLTFCQNQVFDPKVINIFPPWHTVTPNVINNIYMFQYYTLLYLLITLWLWTIYSHTL